MNAEGHPDDRCEIDEHDGDPGQETDHEPKHAAETQAAETETTNTMLVTERETEKGLLVAVCDRDILGETFEEGTFSLTVNEEFYGGEETDEDGVIDSLERATIANIVGTRAVSLAIRAEIIDEANVLEIGTTKHAQLLRMY